MEFRSAREAGLPGLEQVAEMSEEERAEVLIRTLAGTHGTDHLDKLKQSGVPPALYLCLLCVAFTALQWERPLAMSEGPRLCLMTAAAFLNQLEDDSSDGMPGNVQEFRRPVWC